MIKRPFVIMLLSFFLGCMFTKLKVPVAIGIISLGLLLMVLMIYVFKVSNQYINTLDHFLILLPVIMYLGFILMSRQQETNPMNQVFEQKAMGSITGTIYMIVDKGENTQIYLKNNQIELSLSSNSYQSNKIIIYTKNSDQLKMGNQIKVFGEIQKFKPATNLGQFDEAKYYKINGIDYKVMVKNIEIMDTKYSILKQGLYEIKLKLIEVYSSILSEKNAGIVSAMLLGEKSMLEEEIKILYQQNGITHILAISGLHISLIGLTIYKVFNLLGLNQLSSSILSTIIIYCYGLLTNFSVSTNRAIVMLIVSLFANVLGRTYDLLSATALSAFLILIQNPMELYDAGFLLSFGAILGIGIIAPVFIKIFDQVFSCYSNKLKEVKKNNPLSNVRLKNNKIEKEIKRKEIRNKYSLLLCKGFINSLIICFSVNLITLPILLYYFYEVPTYSLIVNLLIIPPMALLTWLTILGGIAGCFHNLTGRFLIGGAHYILEWYELMCHFFQGLPGHMVVVGRPPFVQILLYYITLVVFLIIIKKYEKKRCCAILLLLLLIFYQKNPKELTMTFLDVSQGDGIFIQVPSGTTYLIDGGSSDVSKVGQYRIEPFLKASGIGTIDYAIVTHSDSDHVNGLKELFRSSSIKVKHIILPHTTMIDESYEDLIRVAKRYNINIIYIEKGDVIKDGRVTLTCLHPNLEFTPGSRNAYSTVLSMEYYDFQGLFVGDLEGEGEKLLMDARYQNGSSMLLDYDLLKVAHHGSKYSTSLNFLRRIQPEIAVISCGKDNRYGHPHNELLKRLEEVESKVYITTKYGAITVITDGDRAKINSYMEKNKDLTGYTHD